MFDVLTFQLNTIEDKIVAKVDLRFKLLPDNTVLISFVFCLDKLKLIHTQHCGSLWFNLPQRNAPR